MKAEKKVSLKFLFFVFFRRLCIMWLEGIFLVRFHFIFSYFSHILNIHGLSGGRSVNPYFS